MQFRDTRERSFWIIPSQTIGRHIDPLRKLYCHRQEILFGILSGDSPRLNMAVCSTIKGLCEPLCQVELIGIECAIDPSKSHFIGNEPPLIEPTK